MNNDLISREALKKEIENLIGYSLSYEAILNAIDNAPTVRNEYMRGYEAAMRECKRPQGDWVFDTNVSATVCSRCGGTAPIRISFGVQVESNYCPDCGAKMKGDAE